MFFDIILWLCSARGKKCPVVFTCESEEERYRIEYYKVIDTAIRLLNEYFKTNDIEEYKLTADILLRGEYNKDLCGKYPELNDNLQQVLEFFRIKFSSSYSSQEECRQLFVKMTKEVRSMFTEVEQLLKLLLISPASSCEAER